jgi:hypothetical protein
MAEVANGIETTKNSSVRSISEKFLKGAWRLTRMIPMVAKLMA